MNNILKNLQIKNAKNIKMYIYINIPILFSFEKDKKTFICYVLKYKAIKGQFKYIITEVDDLMLLRLEDNDISLNSLILKNESHLYNIEKETLTEENFADCIDDLPKYNFNINSWFTNKND